MHVMNTIEEVVAWLPAKHAQSTGLQLVPDELRRVLTQARAETIKQSGQPLIAAKAKP
jgi:hypothetical protein